MMVFVANLWVDNVYEFQECIVHVFTSIAKHHGNVYLLYVSACEGNDLCLTR